MGIKDAIFTEAQPSGHRVGGFGANHFVLGEER